MNIYGQYLWTDKETLFYEVLLYGELALNSGVYVTAINERIKIEINTWDKLIYIIRFKVQATETLSK